MVASCVARPGFDAAAQRTAITPTPVASNACGGGAGSVGGARGSAANEFPWPGTDTVITVDEALSPALEWHDLGVRHGQRPGGR